MADNLNKSLLDRRVHVRIPTDLRCDIVSEDSHYKGQLRDLSKGGAQIHVGSDAILVGEEVVVRVEVPVTPEPIRIVGEVSWKRADRKVTQYGIRFCLVDPRQHDDLRRYIDQHLHATGLPTSHHPKLQRRLSIKCPTLDLFRSVLGNVTKGELGLECTVPVVLDQEVKAIIEIEFKKHPLELPGVVAHVSRIIGKKHHVGIRFDAMSAGDQRAVERALDEFIRRVMGRSA